MTPRIDILLPYRNATTTLAACLDSIANQSYPHWRLVAVDDGSVDHSAELLRAFAARSRNVLLLSTGGAGLVSALNLGLQSCTAPLVARMDADDIMYPARLERQAEFLESHLHVGLVAGQVNDTGFEAGFEHYLKWSNQLITGCRTRRPSRPGHIIRFGRSGESRRPGADPSGISDARLS